MFRVQGFRKLLRIHKCFEIRMVAVVWEVPGHIAGWGTVVCRVQNADCVVIQAFMCFTGLGLAWLMPSGQDKGSGLGLNRVRV